jgi:hypothetical protein
MMHGHQQEKQPVQIAIRTERVTISAKATEQVIVIKAFEQLMPPLSSLRIN